MKREEMTIRLVADEHKTLRNKETGETKRRVIVRLHAGEPEDVWEEVDIHSLEVPTE